MQLCFWTRGKEVRRERAPKCCHFLTGGRDVREKEESYSVLGDGRGILKKEKGGMEG